MILVDANILVYAYGRNFSEHERAREWLDAQLTTGPAVGLPWQSLCSFLRIVTNPRIVQNATTFENAWRQVEEWLNCPVVWVPVPESYHRRILGSLLPAAAGNANLVPDAHLAALAIEHGLILCSADRDFARFPGLRWRNPLSA